MPRKQATEQFHKQQQDSRSSHLTHYLATWLLLPLPLTDPSFWLRGSPGSQQERTHVLEANWQTQKQDHQC